MLPILLGPLALVIVGYFLLREAGYGARIRKRAEKIGKAPADPKLKGMDNANLRRETADSSLPLMNRLLQVMPSLNKIAFRLERAGMTISVERYFFTCLGIFCVTTLFFMLALGRSTTLSLLLGIVAGFGFPHIYTGFKGAKRLKMFLRQFPDALDLIVRGLRSGLPVAESMHMVAKELPDPVSRIFHSICDAMRLGVPLEKALADMGAELKLTEFNFFFTSIILQRETGGNLAEILNNLSDTLRKRVMMRLKIKALSSEARASAYIVGALPFVTCLALFFVSPDYLDVLFSDYRGNLALASAFASLFTGVGIMVKMSQLEI